MPEQAETRTQAARPEALRATFAVNRDRLAVGFYAIGTPTAPSPGGIRISLHDNANAQRKIEATAEATQVAAALGRDLAELRGAATTLQPAPVNPIVLALINK